MLLKKKFETRCNNKKKKMKKINKKCYVPVGNVYFSIFRSEVRKIAISYICLNLQSLYLLTKFFLMKKYM